MTNLTALRTRLVNEAGVPAYAAQIEDGQMFVRFDDLDHAANFNEATFGKIAAEVAPDVTDKGFVWTA